MQRKDDAHGFEAARQIPVHERSGLRAPIIAMTAHAMIGDRESCLSRGMDGYIAKPINRAKLVEAVERVAEEFAQPPERYVGMGNGYNPGDLSSTLSSLQRGRDL
jgi:CheY-like chemotaxis protein